jgi:hypothetical protein
MVIIQVPYTLNYKDEARIYHKLILAAHRPFASVHLDPHVLHAAAVFAILSRCRRARKDSRTGQACASTPARTWTACTARKPCAYAARKKGAG